MLARMWRKGNTPPLLVRLIAGATTLEISLEVPQKIGHSTTWGPSYSTPGHIPKRCSNIQQRHMLHYVHSSLIYNSQKLERTQMPSTEEWIQKIWYICTMEYYSEIKNNEFIKFLGKWMKVENIILSQINKILNKKNTMVETYLKIFTILSIKDTQIKNS